MSSEQQRVDSEQRIANSAVGQGTVENPIPLGDMTLKKENVTPKPLKDMALTDEENRRIMEYGFPKHSPRLTDEEKKKVQGVVKGAGEAVHNLFEKQKAAIPGYVQRAKDKGSIKNALVSDEQLDNERLGDDEVGGEQQTGNGGQGAAALSDADWESAPEAYKLDPVINAVKRERARYKDPRSEDVQKMRRKKRNEKVLANLTDAAMALSNMIAVHNYAPNMYDGGNSGSGKVNERWDKFKDDFEKARATARALDEKIAGYEKADADDRYNRWKEGIEMRMKQELEKRRAAEAERKRELDAEKLRDAAAKADYMGTKAKMAGDVYQSQIDRNNRTGYGRGGGGGRRGGGKVTAADKYNADINYLLENGEDITTNDVRVTIGNDGTRRESEHNRYLKRDEAAAKANEVRRKKAAGQGAGNRGAFWNGGAGNGAGNGAGRGAGRTYNPRGVRK